MPIEMPIMRDELRHHRVLTREVIHFLLTVRNHSARLTAYSLFQLISECRINRARVCLKHLKHQPVRQFEQTFKTADKIP